MNLHNKKKLTLDARTKIIMLLLVNVLLISMGDILYPNIATAFFVLLLFIYDETEKALKIIAIYLVVYVITFFVNFASPTIVTAWALISMPIMSSFPLYAVIVVIVATTTIGELIAAFQKLRVPSYITIPLTVMFRFFPSLMMELRNIGNAMKLKGVKFDIIKQLEYVYVPVLFNTSQIIDDLSASGMTRGYNYHKKSTSTYEMKWHIQDFVAIAILVVLIIFRRGYIG